MSRIVLGLTRKEGDVVSDPVSMHVFASHFAVPLPGMRLSHAADPFELSSIMEFEIEFEMVVVVEVVWILSHSWNDK